MSLDAAQSAEELCYDRGVRRGLAAVLMCLCLVSWAAALVPRRSLPPCCKAHGCSMMKRVTHGCAFSRCDQDETAALDGKQVPAVLTVESTVMHDGTSSPLPLVAAIGRPDIAGAPIDHPPRLLFG